VLGSWSRSEKRTEGQRLVQKTSTSREDKRLSLQDNLLSHISLHPCRTRTKSIPTVWYIATRPDWIPASY
jgi:hypothetical protein